jgi:hypothetical protein
MPLNNGMTRGCTAAGGGGGVDMLEAEAAFI